MTTETPAADIVERGRSVAMGLLSERHAKAGWQMQEMADEITRLYAENAELQRKLDEAVFLLDDAQDIFDDAAHPSRVTPDQEVNNEVRELGRRIGFGALMSCASAQWREMLAADGIAGGEFVCSPCRSTASNAADRIDAFLTSIRGEV